MFTPTEISYLLSTLKTRLARLTTRVTTIEASAGIDFSTLPSYGSNTLATAALGVGKLYKSTTGINDSPIILITI